MSETGYKRVYIKHGAFWFVDRDRKWHRLCTTEDGEPAMLRALARHQNAPAARPGSMSSLIADWKAGPLLRYAECTRKDYGLMLGNIEASLRDLDVAESADGRGHGDGHAVRGKDHERIGALRRLISHRHAERHREASAAFARRSAQP